MIEQVEIDLNGEREGLLCSITINNFSEYITISKKRRAKPYIKGKCRIPKKYQTEEYGFDHKDRLVFKQTGQIVVSNSRTAGKPREKKVNGQEIYNQAITEFARNNLVRELHKYFAIYFGNLRPFKLEHYPLELELIFRVVDQGKSNIDNDNKWIWRKAAQDTLTELGIIPDDNPYIIEANRERTRLLTAGEQQSLTINLYKLKN